MSYATWTEPTEIDRNKVRRYAPIRLRGEIVTAIIVELIMIINLILCLLPGVFSGVERVVVILGFFLFAAAVTGYCIYLLMVRIALHKGDYLVAEVKVIEKYVHYHKGKSYYRVITDIQDVSKINTSRKVFDLLMEGDTALAVKVSRGVDRYDIVPL